jgi:hypothetical protein
MKRALFFLACVVFACAALIGRAAGQGGAFSCLAAPRATEGNPYVVRLTEGARAELARPDPAAEWPLIDEQNAAGFFALRGTSDARDARQVAARLDAYLWLYANPASPLRHDPALLDRFLRRARAYVAALVFSGRAGALRGGRDMLDDFALGPALTALREFASVFPERLSAQDHARWEEAFRQIASVLEPHIEGHRSAHAKGYTNIDLTFALHALNLGLQLRDSAWLERSRFLLHLQRGHVLPDGATRYIWSQNECIGYHDVVAFYIARHHEISGDPVALELLRGLEWYGPVSVGRLGEFWTSPSWKQQWNGAGRPAGGEPVVAVTRNPYVRGMVIPPVPGARIGNDWPSARWQVAWWMPDVAARSLPDAYTILDRNIAGPRAWYGRFNYAATLRDIPGDEPGHATLLGAQIVSQDNSRGVILMAVGPRVYLGGDRARPQSFASLTSGIRSALAIGRHHSAFAAEYQLHAFGSSRKGRLVPWRAGQLWLCLPDRMVGVLDVFPESTSSPAARVETLVRFGTGGTVHGPLQTLLPAGPGLYAFGDFIVRIHSSDFAETLSEATPFRLPSAPYGDLVLRDSNPSKGFRRVVVEIRPVSTATDAEVRVADESGFTALRVVAGDKTFTVRRSAPSATGEIAPVRVEVRSADPEDLAPAWPDFASFVSSRP